MKLCWDFTSCLKHVLFAVKEDSEKVAGFLEDAISRHRVRSLACGSTQWRGVTTVTGPHRGAGALTMRIEKGRGQRAGSRSCEIREWWELTQLGIKRWQIQKKAGPWHSVNHLREKEETPQLRKEPKAPLARAIVACVQQSHKAVEDWQTPCLKGLSCLKLSWQLRFSIMPLFRKDMFYLQTQQLCFQKDILMLMSLICTLVSTLIGDYLLWIVDKLIY